MLGIVIAAAIILVILVVYVPMRVSRCVQCGGDMQVVAADGSGARPSPPPELPKYLREGVDRQGPELLQELAVYAARLAAWRAAEAEVEGADPDDVPDEWAGDEWDEVVEEAREQAGLPPEKGTLTTKHIDDRDYYYLQWREGEKIKSQYVAPVAPAGRD